MMTRLEAFNKLAKDNGLYIEINGNLHRAWFNDKDFLMSINIRKEYQALEVASKVLGRKFMLFKQYTKIGPKIYKELDKQIKQLIGEYKKALVQEKLENIKDDFG